MNSHALSIRFDLTLLTFSVLHTEHKGVVGSDGANPDRRCCRGLSCLGFIFALKSISDMLSLECRS